MTIVNPVPQEFKFRLKQAKKKLDEKHGIGTSDTEPPPITEHKTAPKHNFGFKRIGKSQPKPEEKKIGRKGDILYGSGLTKKDLTRMQKQADKAGEIATERELHEHAERMQDETKSKALLQEAEELDFTPPDTMMDPNIVLDQYQEAAHNGILTQRVSVLIGAAGTGKTTLVKALIMSLVDTYGYSPQDIIIMAYTGRAATNVKRAITKEYHTCCDTIHGHLEYTVDFEEFFDNNTEEWIRRRRFFPQRNAANPLTAKVIIAEETGMFPVWLWNQVFDATLPDTRVIMLGDINQLPPVQGRSVLPFAMLQWPTYTLEEPHRQAEGDAIIENAHRILKGFMPLRAPNFVIKEIGDGSITAFKDILGTIKHLHKMDKFNPLQDALIVPKNKSQVGQREINSKLVHYFNPPRKIGDSLINPRTLIQAGVDSKVFAIGDKVMLLENDRQKGLTNGMIGVIQEIYINDRFKGDVHNPHLDDIRHQKIDISEFGDLAEQFNTKANQTLTDKENGKVIDEEQLERQASHVTVVKFQNVDETVDFAAVGEYKKLAHSYAFTCHKSQGGEFPTVVILCHSLDSVMLNREWLYTAVTRAKERVIILTNKISKRGLVQAINTQRIKGNSIAEKAESFLKIMNETDSEHILPLLQEPESITLPTRIDNLNEKLEALEEAKQETGEEDEDPSPVFQFSFTR